MYRKLMMLFAVIMMTASTTAQIPADVKEVLRKCDEKMASYITGGMMIDGTMKMKVSILSFNGTLKMYGKNKKFFVNMSIKAMKEIGINMEMGFDGEQEWVYKTVTGDDSKDKDTLIITKKRDAENAFGPRTDYDKEYKKAKMKVIDRYYEITFSGPLKKDISKKKTIKIDKENYLMREYSVNEDLGPFTGKLTMTITKITKGCSDNWLKLDMNRYKNAVIVRH